LGICIFFALKNEESKKSRENEKKKEMRINQVDYRQSIIADNQTLMCQCSFIPCFERKLDVNESGWDLKDFVLSSALMTSKASSIPTDSKGRGEKKNEREIGKLFPSFNEDELSYYFAWKINFILNTQH
jgi:hypothetical protein